MNNSSQRNIVLISPVGNRDPWDKWNETKDGESVNKKPQFYGPTLTVLEEHPEKIRKAIFITTIETEKAKSLIKEELNQVFPDIEVEWKESGLDKANDPFEIHRAWGDLVEKIKQEESGNTLWINLSPGTTQMRQYLEMRIQLGFFGEPFKEVFSVEVPRPEKNMTAKRTKILDKPKHDPSQEMLDASHIAALIETYDYHAARKLIRSGSNLSQKLSSSLLFLKDAMDLNDTLKPSKLFQVFLEEPLNNNKDHIIVWLAYCAAQIKFERKEYQDAILRASSLREFMLVELIKQLSTAQPYLSTEGTKTYLKITDCEQRKAIEDIGKADPSYRGKFDVDRVFTEDNHTKATLMADNSLLFLTWLLKNEPDNNILIPFKTSTELKGFRNTYGHSVSVLKNLDIPKIKSFSKHLTAMFQVFAEKTGMTIDIEKNFFDLANRALLQEHELDWLIDKNGRSTHGNRAKNNPEKTLPTKQETCPV
jgi:hypothetical protein